MSVLGTTIVYLEPEESNTRDIYCIVMGELGKEEILLSYSEGFRTPQQEFPQGSQDQNTSCSKKSDCTCQKDQESEKEQDSQEDKTN